MSYISIIVPAFHLNTMDKNDISNYCCSQFNITESNFSLIEFNHNQSKDKSHYGIIFNESNLSLKKIEQLIYEKNCIENFSKKSFESLQLLSKKITELEKSINIIKEEKIKFEEKIKNQNLNLTNNINGFNNDDKKGNDKIENSEKNINNIKIEFKNLADDIELINSSNNQKLIQNDIITEKIKQDDDNININNNDIITKN